MRTATPKDSYHTGIRYKVRHAVQALVHQCDSLHGLCVEK